MSKHSGENKAKRIGLWILALVITALVSSIFGWYINDILSNATKTKIFDYAYIEASEEDHEQSGTVECFANGLGLRTDVYKCSEGNVIHAPCFRDDITENVKCTNDPNSNSNAKYFRATFTQYTEPLIKTYGKEPQPWYVVLDTGEKCRYVYGITTLVANKRLDFLCGDSPIKLYLPVKNENGVSSIACMKNDRLEYCKIKEMWR